MGWIWLLALGAITAAGLWRFGKLPRSALELPASALLLAVAGYAWQGRPALDGRPPPSRAAERRPDSAFAVLRGTMMPRFGRDADVQATADAFARNGLDAYSVGILKGALGRNHNRPDLWVGLGNALVLHGKGLVTPAAELAFARAAALSPEHPAPPFFLGLAYLQAGEVDRARELWVPLLARTPDRAPWRPTVATALTLLESGA